MSTTERPTVEVSVRDVFGIDSGMTVKGYAEPSDRVPTLDNACRRQSS